MTRSWVAQGTVSRVGVCQSVGARQALTVRAGEDAMADQEARHAAAFTRQPGRERYRSGLRVTTTLAESAVNSLVGKRMVKKQQMRWSRHGARKLMQVRTAELNGELH